MNAKFKIQNGNEIQKKTPQLWWGEILVIFNHASGAKILLIEFRSLTCIEEKSLILHFEFCILNCSLERTNPLDHRLLPQWLEGHVVVHTEAVIAARVDVQRRLHAVLAQGVVVACRADRGHQRVVIRGEDQGRGRIFRLARLQRVLCTLVGCGLLAQQVVKRTLVAESLLARDYGVEQHREGGTVGKGREVGCVGRQMTSSR